MRRAKFVLSRVQMAQALGVPDDVRVIGMHVTHDPDTVHVVIEGDGVPEYQDGFGEAGELAAAGWTESRIVPHPSERFRIIYDGWVLGGPSSEMRLRTEAAGGSGGRS